MIKTNSITLTVNELVSVLTLCGYDHIASQILNEQNLISNEAEFNRFVQEAETGLKQKGYWDDGRDSKVSRGLEDLIYLLVHSKHKVRCVNMAERSVLLIHSLKNENSLVQEVRNGEHSFYFLNRKDGFRDVLREHHGMEDSEISVEGWQPIEMTDKLFDEVHTSEPAVLQAMVNDEEQSQPFRDFGRDFLKNVQEFDNISCMRSNYVKDQSEVDQVVFLVPGDDFIWHLDYSRVATENKVRMEPIPVRSFFEEIERVLVAFFDE